MNDKDNILNIILIQYYPAFNKIDDNIQKLEKLLEKYNRSDVVDIIVFPEMALTGYNFDNLDEIKDCFEDYNKGKTYDFCSKLSTKYL